MIVIYATSVNDVIFCRGHVNCPNTVNQYIVLKIGTFPSDMAPDITNTFSQLPQDIYLIFLSISFILRIFRRDVVRCD